jgi:hypothetical protein
LAQTEKTLYLKRNEKDTFLALLRQSLPLMSSFGLSGLNFTYPFYSTEARTPILGAATFSTYLQRELAAVWFGRSLEFTCGRFLAPLDGV